LKDSQRKAIHANYSTRKTIPLHLGLKKGDFVATKSGGLSSSTGRITKLTKYDNGNVFASILLPFGDHYGHETKDLIKVRKPDTILVKMLNDNQPKHDKYLSQFKDGKF